MTGLEEQLVILPGFAIGPQRKFPALVLMLERSGGTARVLTSKASSSPPSD